MGAFIEVDDKAVIDKSSRSLAVKEAHSEFFVPCETTTAENLFLPLIVPLVALKLIGKERFGVVVLVVTIDRY